MQKASCGTLICTRQSIPRCGVPGMRTSVQIAGGTSQSSTRAREIGCQATSRHRRQRRRTLSSEQHTYAYVLEAAKRHQGHSQEKHHNRVDIIV